MKNLKLFQISFIIILTVLGIVILCVTAYKGYFCFGPKKWKKSVPLETVKVQKKDIWETIEVSGEVHGYSEEKIFSSVQGKVRSMAKNTGSRIEKNETIVEIVRNDPLRGDSVVKIKSPMRGVITRYFVNENDTVFPNFPLAEVASVERVKIEVKLSEKDSPKVQNGQDALIYVDKYPKSKFKGKLAYLKQLESKPVNADIDVPNIGYQLKPGMLVKVKILVKQYQNALVISQEAITRNIIKGNVVFVVDSEGFVVLRKVKLGLREEGVVHVLSGIGDGENVVNSGQLDIREGIKILLNAKD